jgi:phosphatidylglycerophosphate synthase
MIMRLVKLAIIFLPPCPGQYAALLQRDFAGIKILDRLILTLQRVGLDEIIISYQGSVADIRLKTEEGMVNDSRFQGNITWQEQEEGEAWKFSGYNQTPIKSQNILVVKGNVVVTASTIQDFIEKSSKEGVFGQDEIIGIEGPQIKSGNIFLCSLSKLGVLKNYVKSQNIQDSSNFIFLGGPRHFAKLIEDEHSARQTERAFINLHKHYYKQFMDFWVNSYFSLRISSLLVKSPVTPNVITLLGLVIGLFSAWQFSRGDYWGGLLGGLAFAGTSIWDCCDGDIARLKFMESDFGDKLDTTCDNLNNVFAFTGIMIGVAMSSGFLYALIPFVLLCVGGVLIFYFIYFPIGGKGSFFHGTWIYDVIQHLASRNFVYVVLLFGIFGHMDWFLWLSGFGSVLFAIALYLTKSKFI